MARRPVLILGLEYPAAAAGNLTAQGSTGYGPLSTPATFSFRSNFTDSLTAVGGTGPGTVEFTLTYTWGGLEDIGAANDAANFSFNGASAWSESAQVCNTPPIPNCPGGTTNTIQKVIDEPVFYGTPFSYAADVGVTGSGHGVYEFNSLTISSALLTGGQLIEVPEPSSLSLYGVALLALFLRSCRLSRRLG